MGNNPDYLTDHWIPYPHFIHSTCKSLQHAKHFSKHSRYICETNKQIPVFMQFMVLLETKNK